MNRRLISLLALVTLALQSLVVVRAEPLTDGLEAHCAGMDSSITSDENDSKECCSCCTDGSMMSGTCTSVCTVLCSHEGSTAFKALSSGSAAFAFMAPAQLQLTYLPLHPPPIF